MLVLFKAALICFKPSSTSLLYGDILSRLYSVPVLLVKVVVIKVGGTPGIFPEVAFPVRVISSTSKLSLFNVDIYNTLFKLLPFLKAMLSGCGSICNWFI